MGIVSCNLVGRMGNQMMTASCAISYALRHGLEYHIPAHTLNDSVWKPMFTHLENPNWNPMVVCHTKEDLEKNGKLNVVLKERTHSYEEIPFKEEWRNEKINIIIDGYRQSLKYFEDYLPEVRKAFGFDYTVKRPDTFCFHNRLGDYKLYPTKHTILSPYYISSAFGIMKENGYKKCLVFSDDIEETEALIKSMPHLQFDFEYSKNKTELEDFQLMLKCGSFVISASTYSLMAAILSESENKVCVSPSSDNWFQIDNKHLDCSTIIPDYFIQIKY